MTHSFPSHGDLLECRRDGQIVAVHGRGSTNLEAAQAFSNAMAPLVAELEDSRWAVLGTADGDVVLTPDAEAHMTAAAPILTAKGRIAVAVVLPESPMRPIIQSQWARVYANAGCEVGYFVDRELARGWLGEVLAQK